MAGKIDRVILDGESHAFEVNSSVISEYIVDEQEDKNKAKYDGKMNSVDRDNILMDKATADITFTYGLYTNTDGNKCIWFATDNTSIPPYLRKKWFGPSFVTFPYSETIGRVEADWSPGASVQNGETVHYRIISPEFKYFAEKLYLDDVEDIEINYGENGINYVVTFNGTQQSSLGDINWLTSDDDEEPVKFESTLEDDVKINTDTMPFPLIVDDSDKAKLIVKLLNNADSYQIADVIPTAVAPARFKLWFPDVVDPFPGYHPMVDGDFSNSDTSCMDWSQQTDLTIEQMYTGSDAFDDAANIDYLNTLTNDFRIVDENEYRYAVTPETDFFFGANSFFDNTLTFSNYLAPDKFGLDVAIPAIHQSPNQLIKFKENENLDGVPEVDFPGIGIGFDTPVLRAIVIKNGNDETLMIRDLIDGLYCSNWVNDNPRSSTVVDADNELSITEAREQFYYWAEMLRSNPEWEGPEEYMATFRANTVNKFDLDWLVNTQPIVVDQNNLDAYGLTIHLFYEPLSWWTR